MGVADALLRMQAVLNVLDEDIRRSAGASASLPQVKLSDERWPAAETIRREIERDLLELKWAASDARAQSCAWQRNAEIATASGHGDLAVQAQRRVSEADGIAETYEKECAEIEAFLLEWAVRVSTTDPEQGYETRRGPAR